MPTTPPNERIRKALAKAHDQHADCLKASTVKEVGDGPPLMEWACGGDPTPLTNGLYEASVAHIVERQTAALAPLTFVTPLAPAGRQGEGLEWAVTSAVLPGPYEPAYRVPVEHTVRFAGTEVFSMRLSVHSRMTRDGHEAALADGRRRTAAEFAQRLASLFAHEEPRDDL